MSAEHLPDQGHPPGPYSTHLEVENVENADGALVLIVRGEVDVESVSVLETALTAAANRHVATVVLDLSKLEFIDSSGISVLIRAQLRANDEGWHLILRDVPPQAARVFSVAGLSSRFTIIQGALS